MIIRANVRILFVVTIDQHKSSYKSNQQGQCASRVWWVCLSVCASTYVCLCANAKKVPRRSPRGELRKEGELVCSVECGDRRVASASSLRGSPGACLGELTLGSAVGGEGSFRPYRVGLGSFQGAFRRTASGFLKALGNGTSEGPVLPEVQCLPHDSFICSCLLL